MIQSSYKDHLSKLKYRLSYSQLFESYMLSFWRLLKFFGDKNLEISRQDLNIFIHMLQVFKKLWAIQVKP